MSSLEPTSIRALLDTLRQRTDCVLHPPQGLPLLLEGQTLPEDLREFYTCCGGASLHENADYPCQLLPPSDFKQANFSILSELPIEEVQVHLPADHFSWSWYRLAAFDTPSELIAVSCQPPQLGTCYKCNWVTYPDAANVAASSFTSLLQRLVNDAGGTFWEDLFERQS